MADEGDALYAPLVEFITTRIWGSPRDMTDGTVMAVTDGNKIIGACLFHNWQPDEGVVEMTSASVSARVSASRPGSSHDLRRRKAHTRLR